MVGDEEVCQCGRSRVAGVHEVGAQNGHTFEPWQPATSADVEETNPRMVANQLRALERKLDSRLESIDLTLKTFKSVLDKQEVLIDGLNVANRRIDELERRQSSTEARLAALEARPRGSARK